MNFENILPNWSELSKTEQNRIKKLWSEDYRNFDGNASISKEELNKAEKYALTLEEAGSIVDSELPLGANTPLSIPNVDFIDYRDPIWGDSYNWSWNRPLNQVEYLVIHHTVTSSETTPDDIALLHKARGWGGIGYHFVITSDGKVWYVGDIGTARANVADMNEKVIGIALIGDFTKYEPTSKQISATHYLCSHFLFNTPELVNTGNWNDVVGHKELSATACPGNDWEGAFKQSIINNTTDPNNNQELEEAYNLLKARFRELENKYNVYREKHDWQIDFYHEAEKTWEDYFGYNVDENNFGSCLDKVMVDANTAKRLFNIGKQILVDGEKLEYPEDITLWIGGMEQTKKRLEEYKEYKSYNLPIWIVKIIELFGNIVSRKKQGGEE